MIFYLIVFHQGTYKKKKKPKEKHSHFPYEYSTDRYNYRSTCTCILGTISNVLWFIQFYY